MIHFRTTFCCTPLHSSLSIFLHFVCFRNIYSSSSSFHVLPKHLHFSFVTLSGLPPSCRLTILKQKMRSPLHQTFQKSSLKAAIFHTMAYKLSLEINKNKIKPKTLIVFLKVSYNVAQIKKKKITF